MAFTRAGRSGSTSFTNGHHSPGHAFTKEDEETRERWVQLWSMYKTGSPIWPKESAKPSRNMFAGELLGPNSPLKQAAQEGSPGRKSHHKSFLDAAAKSAKMEKAEAEAKARARERARMLAAKEAALMEVEDVMKEKAKKHAASKAAAAAAAAHAEEVRKQETAARKVKSDQHPSLSYFSHPTYHARASPSPTLSLNLNPPISPHPAISTCMRSCHALP